jgi:four helix bundle protein
MLADCPDFGFRDQATRSALSVASNIAEGVEHRSIPDKTKFLDYARGSCCEFHTQATVGKQAGLVDETTSDRWIETSRELSAMIQGLIRALERKPPAKSTARPRG